MRIDDYVADLDRALAGPSGPKRDLVVEARDSLIDTADALEAQGRCRAEAELLAVREFGAVADIAPGYQDELTAASGRRLGLLLFLTVPVMVVMWALVWRVYPTDPVAWANRPAWFSGVSRLLDATHLVIGLYGGLALFALGRGTRWIGRPYLVTKSLGVVVWTMLPLTGAMSMLLTYGSDVPDHAATYLPAVLANLMTAAIWGLQLYGASRCLKVTRTA